MDLRGSCVIFKLGRGSVQRGDAGKRKFKSGVRGRGEKLRSSSWRFAEGGTSFL